MIEEIKKEIITIKDQMLKQYKVDDKTDKTREFYYIQCLDMMLRIIEEHNNQPDYKSAFINAKERLEDFNDYDFIEELEQKYKLGGE